MDINLRSLLFVPGDSRRKVEKAVASNADVVILDLEDAVAPSAKAAARAVVVECLGAERTRAIAVRVNGMDTPHYLEDLAAVAAARPEIVMLPKCAGPRDVMRLCAQLDVLETEAGIPLGTISILPLVTETAAALAEMNYRGASRRLVGLAVAGEDLSADLGIQARTAQGLNPLLQQARRAVAFSAAAAGVVAIDTPFADPRDEAGLAREAEEAALLGFAGKMCIHPAQIDVVHAAFQVSDAAAAWAEAVVAAFASTPGEGVTLLEGKMIDRAHLRLAQRRLRQCGRT